MTLMTKPTATICMDTSPGIPSSEHVPLLYLYDVEIVTISYARYFFFAAIFSAVAVKATPDVTQAPRVEMIANRCGFSNS